MGFRMRRSISLAPGVRLNVSKRGLGMSVGAGGVRYSAHSSGRRTISARTGIPGVWYQESATKGARRRAAPTPVAPPEPPKPGIFAPKPEKELFEALSKRDRYGVWAVGEENEELRVAAYSISGFMALTEDDPDGGKRLLEIVWQTGSEPANDPFVKKYVHSALDMPIADGVTAHVPLGRDAVGLALAELYQVAGELDRAIEIVEHLEPTTYAAISLAELYADAKRYADVIEMSEGVQNEDDTSALLLVFRGIAFREQGLHDAAHETFKEALRARSRGAEIRHRALFERAENFRTQGKVALARKDLERILAEDSDYAGIRKRLADLA